MTAGPLGRFLELALPAPDLLATWHALHGLGFAEAPTTDARPAGYAAFSDGRVALGLHQQATVPELVFVRPGLQQAAASIAVAGLEPTEWKLGENTAHELAFLLPGGPGVRVLEARTFSPPSPGVSAATGWFTELMLPVTDPSAAANVLEALGFVCLGEEAAPVPHLALTSDTLNVGLYRHRALQRPGLLFQTSELAALQVAAERAGLDALPAPDGVEANLLLLRLPEGTPLWIMLDT